MSMVCVKYRGNLTSLAGAAEETIDAGNVADLLKFIGKRHGREALNAAKSMLIALNGENILFLKRYKTVLSEGDTISFYPLCAGG